MRAWFGFRLVAVFTIGLVSFALKTSADTTDQPRVYQGRAVHQQTDGDYVPLQPFSLDAPPFRPSTIRVAYFAPHAIPRAQRVEADDEPERIPDFQRGGSRPIVPGNRAILRNGVAYAPSNAPSNVKSAIWAVNAILSKPYHWGGGHGSFYDSGYDCSGAVSYALHYAGVLDQPLPSSDLLRYGDYGRGRWITIYSRHGHTFAMIAGLRLDTTDLNNGGDVGPRWYTSGRETWGFEARHPIGL